MIKKTRSATLATLTHYELMGFGAFEIGKRIDESPYAEQDTSQAHRDWVWGWETGSSFYKGKVPRGAAT